MLWLRHDHYPRATDEGRTLLHAAFPSPGRLEVIDGELHVTLAAPSSSHRTAALTALCQQLDATPTPFPGTNLRLRLGVGQAVLVEVIRAVGALRPWKAPKS